MLSDNIEIEALLNIELGNDDNDWMDTLFDPIFPEADLSMIRYLCDGSDNDESSVTSTHGSYIAGEGSLSSESRTMSPGFRDTCESDDYGPECLAKMAGDSLTGKSVNDLADGAKQDQRAQSRRKLRTVKSKRQKVSKPITTKPQPAKPQPGKLNRPCTCAHATPLKTFASTYPTASFTHSLGRLTIPSLSAHAPI
jgi:hypothetical protein